MTLLIFNIERDKIVIRNIRFKRNLLWAARPAARSGYSPRLEEYMDSSIIQTTLCHPLLLNMDSNSCMSSIISTIVFNFAVINIWHLTTPITRTSC